MRKSVERRRQQASINVQKSAGFRRRHRLVISLVVVLVAACGTFIYLADQKQKSDTAAQKAAQVKAFALLDKQVKATLQKRIDDAKKAEAEAKAKAEAEMATQKAAAAANPAGTTTKATCDVSNPTSITVILNKKHCFSPIDWAPSDLVSVDGYYLRSEAADHMQTMMADAATAGVGFTMSSAYRGYANQIAVYNMWVSTNGSQAAADTVSARPGFSEHQTGLVADLKAGSCVLECFATTAQYTWLAEHAAEYGYIRRYPDGLTSITGYAPEAWHWRYVGIAIAKDMQAKGIQTMEQYFGVSGGDYS